MFDGEESWSKNGQITLKVFEFIKIKTFHLNSAYQDNFIMLCPRIYIN